MNRSPNRPRSRQNSNSKPVEVITLSSDDENSPQNSDSHRRSRTSSTTSRSPLSPQPSSSPRYVVPRSPMRGGRYDDDYRRIVCGEPRLQPCSSRQLQVPSASSNRRSPQPSSSRRLQAPSVPSSRRSPQPSTSAQRSVPSTGNRTPPKKPVKPYAPLNFDDEFEQMTKKYPDGSNLPKKGVVRENGVVVADFRHLKQQMTKSNAIGRVKNIRNTLNRLNDFDAPDSVSHQLTRNFFEQKSRALAQQPVPQLRYGAVVRPGEEMPVNAEPRAPSPPIPEGGRKWLAVMAARRSAPQTTRSLKRRRDSHSGANAKKFCSNRSEIDGEPLDCGVQARNYNIGDVPAEEPEAEYNRYGSDEEYEEFDPNEEDQWEF